MFLSVLRREFRLVQLGLIYPDAADFVQSPWFGLPFVLLYRFVIAAFCIGWMIARTFDDEKWYIWLSNWSFVLLALYFVCATMVTALHYRRRSKTGGYNLSNKMENGMNNVESKGKQDDTTDRGGNSNNNTEIREPTYILGERHMSDVSTVACIADTREGTQVTQMAWFHKAMWVIYNMSASGSLMVTIVFWILLYDPDKGIRGFTIVYHGFNAIAMIVDTMLCSIPVRLFHVVYPMLNGAVYVIFTVIYWAVGGTNSFGMPYIYPQTDYTGRPVLSVVSQVCLMFIGVPLCQCLMFGFYGLRCWIKTKCGK
ncbi:hypothetical protein ACROYT_G005068 [Oculina patagonica]